MKTFLLSATPAVAAMLFASVALGPSQTTKSFPDPPVVSDANPVRARMTAVIAPLEKDSEVNGQVTIIPGGDGATVVGRISGLEPTKRYQIMVQPPAAAATPKPSQEPAKPGSNVPASGVTGTEPPALGEDLGMLVSDANGNALVDATLRRIDKALFPEGFNGCTVVIKRAPPLDSPGERPAIASGRIVLSPAATSIPPAAVPNTQVR
jgi:hypothetical protein